jgi:hypothetical protein
MSPGTDELTEEMWRHLSEQGRLEVEMFRYGSQLLAKGEAPPEAEPPAADTSNVVALEAVPPVYLSPFLKMMLDAVKQFGITEDAPGKKEILVRFFRSQKLPDGSAISKVQAEYLATFCRSPEAMKGGNKR